jgi:hypothetical protein
MSCFEKDSFVKKQPPLVHRVLMGALMAGSLCLPAHADNQMGYRLLSDQDAQNLPRNHGALGMAIEAAQRITDGGMTFDLIRVKQVRSGSPGASRRLRNMSVQFSQVAKSMWITYRLVAVRNRLNASPSPSGWPGKRRKLLLRRISPTSRRPASPPGPRSQSAWAL